MVVMGMLCFCMCLVFVDALFSEVVTGLAIS
jgi:hypothetical protein